MVESGLPLEHINEIEEAVHRRQQQIGGAEVHEEVICDGPHPSVS